MVRIGDFADFNDPGPTRPGKSRKFPMAGGGTDRVAPPFHGKACPRQRFLLTPRLPADGKASCSRQGFLRAGLQGPDTGVSRNDQRNLRTRAAGPGLGIASLGGVGMIVIVQRGGALSSISCTARTCPVTVDPSERTVAGLPLNWAIRKRRTSFWSAVSNVNMERSLLYPTVADLKFVHHGRHFQFA